MATIIKNEEKDFQPNPNKIDGFRLLTDRARDFLYWVKSMSTGTVSSAERLPHDTSSFAFTYTLAVARPLVVMPEVGSLRSAISSRPAMVFDSLVRLA